LFTLREDRLIFVLNTIKPIPRPIKFPKPNEYNATNMRQVQTRRHPISRYVKHLYIAVVQVGNEVRCKVGITSNLKKRLRDLQSANAFHVELYKEYNWHYLVKHLPVDNQKEELAREVENIVKKKYEKQTSHHNSTEWYNIVPEKLEVFIDKVMNERLRTALPYGMNDRGGHELEAYRKTCLGFIG